MASGAVWGIDIGQCALKALRCRAHDEPDKVVAEAFDYIEYPKILSQAGSDPAELIGDALKQFLSRNSVVGDRVAISVSGQAGLARFIKLPPVEAKKIPDIVRYEARQQIPFDLNDVIWDYQRMGGGSEEEGFALETEIGLFAMKRDAVFRALDPLLKANIEVDIVQLVPEVLYNFLVFDQLGPLPSPEEYDPENPPESAVIISVGTDATDLVITNGFRMWQRSIPIGGSHFTKALTKELKLTFAKAEHVKRNAAGASDPKALFQAMKLTFSDLLTELQRSISYFSNLDRAAKIGRVLALGNAMKLPGLRRYLSQSLGLEIEKIDAFRGVTGSQVVAAPAFQENVLSFGVSYGLALQALGLSGIHTNLLPKEILRDRLIQRKKPWAAAAAAALLLGCTLSYAAYSWGLTSVAPSKWSEVEGQAKQLNSQASALKTEFDAASQKFTEIDQIGKNLVLGGEAKVRWLEILKAINSCLPSDPPTKSGEKPIPIMERKQLELDSFECKKTEDMSQYYSEVKQWYPTEKPAAAAPGAPAAAPADPNAAVPPPADPNAAAAPTAEASSDATPSGTGWVFQISGHHYHNLNLNDSGQKYVNRTLIESLRNGTVELPTPDGKGSRKVALRDLGISHPVLVGPKLPVKETLDKPDGDTEDVKRFDFTVRFFWTPKTGAEPGAAESKPTEAASPPQP